MSSQSTVKIVQPTGMLDGTTAKQFRETIAEVLSEGAEIVLVDLKETTFIDSSGLGALASALKTVNSTGGKIFFAAPNEQVKMVFELTCMDRAFKIFDDREAFDQSILQSSN
jgi:anti-anti-sigma factor